MTEHRAIGGLVPHTDEHVHEVQKLNELIAQVMAALPSIETEEDLAVLRASGGVWIAPYDGPVETGSLPGPAGPVPTRTFEPADRAPRAVLLDIHGGGWCLGEASDNDAINAAAAERLGVAVVSIDYRLAPENPWPACADDCEAAARWLIDEGPRRWNTEKLAISGASAGAHLAAVTLLRLRDAGLANRFVAANLIFGAFDLGLSPSQRSAQDALLIPLENLLAFYRHTFVGTDHEDRRHPSISPLYADLSGLCPALFTVGTADPLLDDSMFMAARWQAAGNEVRLDLYPECAHGFAVMPIELGRQAIDRAQSWLDEMISR